MHKCVDTEKLLVVVQGRHGLLGSSCTSIVFTGHRGTLGDTGRHWETPETAHRWTLHWSPGHSTHLTLARRVAGRGVTQAHIELLIAHSVFLTENVQRQYVM